MTISDRLRLIEMLLLCIHHFIAPNQSLFSILYSLVVRHLIETGNVVWRNIDAKMKISKVAVEDVNRHQARLSSTTTMGVPVPLF